MYLMNKNYTINNVNELIEAFGGTGRFARELSTTEQNVCNFRARSIPPGFHLKILCLCVKKGCTISPSVFGIDPNLFKVLEEKMNREEVIA